VKEEPKARCVELLACLQHSNLHSSEGDVTPASTKLAFTDLDHEAACLRYIACSILAAYYHQTTEPKEIFPAEDPLNAQNDHVQSIATLLVRVAPDNIDLAVKTMKPLKELAPWPLRSVASLIMMLFELILEQRQSQYVLIASVLRCISSTPVSFSGQGLAYSALFEDTFKAWYKNFGETASEFLKTQPLKNEKEKVAEMSSWNLRRTIYLLGVPSTRDDDEVAGEVISCLGEYAMAPESLANFVRTSLSTTLMDVFQDVLTRRWDLPVQYQE
jgi:hypothetical protein